MNHRVTELTGMALRIMNYQMYDRFGFRNDSLYQLIQPNLMALQDTGEAAVQPDQLECNKRNEQQFMAEFGIPDVTAILKDPVPFADKQLASFYAQLDGRIMQAKMMPRSRKKAEELRATNLKNNEVEIRSFTSKVKNGYPHALYRLEVAVGATWSQTDEEIFEAYEAKFREQFEEFQMLLDLLKIILEDIPDNWHELDNILNLMKASQEALKYIE